MTLMPTYITIDERMRLGYCTPLVEVGPGVWHHLLFGDVVETVYDPRWWFLRPGFNGGLVRRPGGGAIGGYFAPGDGPPQEQYCLGDPAIVSGPIYYDDYEPVGWWGRWFGGGRRRRRRHGPHHGPHGPRLGPPARRGPHLGPPIRRGGGASPPSNNSNLKSGVMYPSSTPTRPSSMSLVTHPNAGRAARIDREVQAWLQPRSMAPMRPSLTARTYGATMAPYRAPMHLVSKPTSYTTAPYRQTMHVVTQPTRMAPMRSSGGGFRAGSTSHLRGLGALLMRALGR